MNACLSACAFPVFWLSSRQSDGCPKVYKDAHCQKKTAITANRKETRLNSITQPGQPKTRWRRISGMNSSTTDKMKGTAKEVAGKVKEETGKAVGNPNLEDRGTTEKIAGKVERKVGDVKKVIGK